MWSFVYMNRRSDGFGVKERHRGGKATLEPSNDTSICISRATFRHRPPQFAVGDGRQRVSFNLTFIKAPLIAHRDVGSSVDMNDRALRNVVRGARPKSGRRSATGIVSTLRPQ